MALEIGAPTEATEAPPKRQTNGREYGPNLFLDNGWLQASYESDKWYDVPAVDGAFVMLPAQRGKVKGQPVEKLTGTAAEVVRQLREAAAELGIGVSIKYRVPVVERGAKKGQPIEGQLVVQYLGTVRKQRKEKTPAAAADGNPETEGERRFVAE